MSDPDPQPSSLYYRHRLPVRIMHWINVIAFFILLMSGLQIFNAHPALNWGKSSYTGQPPLLEMTAAPGPEGKIVGVTRVFGREFYTTGVLGASVDWTGEMVERGFPDWATVPESRDLAKGRRWHLLFAWLFVINGLCYVLYSIFSRHLTRDLTPSKTDWRGIGRSLKDHLLFRHPRGEAEKHYNVLQKLAYLLIVFGVLPLAVLTGWAMSPWLDTAIPGWVDLLGGRQSGRTIHFLAASFLFLFLLIHVFEVVVSGVWNNLRSMITGRYRLHAEETPNETD